MADRQIQQIRSIYGEILGIADHLPSHIVKDSVINLYNSAIDELSAISATDYGRFKITQSEISRNYANSYRVDSVKPKMGAVLARLEQEFGFSKPQRGVTQPATNIVTIHNSNQLSITIVPIQTIIETITDDDLRADVEALKEVIETTKDKRQASTLLSTIQQKSWDVFLALLPVVLENLGKS